MPVHLSNLKENQIFSLKYTFSHIQIITLAQLLLNCFNYKNGKPKHVIELSILIHNKYSDIKYSSIYQ